MLFHPTAWTLQPDRLSIYNPMYMISRHPPPIETVGGDTRVGTNSEFLKIVGGTA